VKGQEEYFFEGVFFAVCLLVRLHGKPEIAAEIIKEAGIETWDCTGLNNYEKEILKTINKENGIALRGL